MCILTALSSGNRRGGKVFRTRKPFKHEGEGHFGKPFSSVKETDLVFLCKDRMLKSKAFTKDYLVNILMENHLCAR